MAIRINNLLLPYSDVEILALFKKLNDIPLEGIQGVDGREIQLRATELAIQWKYNTEEEWQYLISLEQIRGLQGEKGEKGDKGLKGDMGEKGDKGDTGLKGDKGDTGSQGIQGHTGDTGATGKDGKSLEFQWRGTELGVRQEGEVTFQYVDLKGEGMEGLGLPEIQVSITEPVDENILLWAEVDENGSLTGDAELDDRIVELNNKIKETDNKANITGIEVASARTTVKGEECENLDKRLLKDFSDVKASIDNINYIEGNGTLDRTLSGELRDIVVEGGTHQNLKNRFDVSTWQGITRTTHISFSNNMIKPSTIYTVIFEVTEVVLDGISAINVIVGDYDGPITITNTVSSPGLYVAKITTNSIIRYGGWLAIKGTSGQWTGSSVNRKMVISDTVRILEGDYTNKPIPPYFEGIESVAEREKIGDKYQLPIKVIGKNLFDGVCDLTAIGNKGYGETYIENQKYVYDGTNITEKNNYGLALANLKLPKNKTLTMTYKHSILEGTSTYANLRTRVYGNNGSSEVVIKESTTGILTFETGIYDSYRINFYIGFGENKCKFNLWDIQLEEGTTSTQYEPYKEQSKTVLLNEPLRSLPNGVKDIACLDKGYVDRLVDKSVFTGEVNESWVYATKVDNTLRFYSLEPRNYKKAGKNTLFSNRLPYVHNEGDSSVGISDYNTDGRVYLKIDSGLLQTEDVQGLRGLLQKWKNENNPLTMYYEKATPIQEPVPKLTLKSYEGKTYLGTTNYIQPVVKAKALTNVSVLLSSLRVENEELKSNNEMLKIANEGLVKGHNVQDIKIGDTEEALNYLLMDSIGMNMYSLKNRDKREVNRMESYLAKQIYQGRLDYDEVVKKYPQFKDGIDKLLQEYVENGGIIYKQ
ncbi:MAG: hypothetical protein ACRDDY_02575 [Clostridium sp.]|uniref:hypothetical protein n=1 Tax=Clostridium sp. TaxID=1506 RepID=UPI003EE45D18